MKTSKKSLALAVILSLGVCANAWAAGTGAVQVGAGTTGSTTGATATGENSIAIGNSSGTDKNEAVSENSIAIGTNAIAGSNRVDYYTREYCDTNAIAIGSQAKAEGKSSIAIGEGADTGEQGGSWAWQNIAIGSSYTDNQGVIHKTSAWGNNAISIGTAATTKGLFSIALGALSNATSSESIAIGYEVESGFVATSIGSRSSATGQQATAYGAASHAEGNFSTSVGQNTHATSELSVAMGSYASAVDEKSVAVGTYAGAIAKSSTAVGSNVYAYGENSFVAGSGSKAYKKSSNAIGDNAFVNGANSIAIGTSAKVGFYKEEWIEEEGKPDIKVITDIPYKNAIAFGNSTEVAADESIAFGSNASAFGKNSVAIGANSTVSKGQDNVVSVGAADAERRIINVDKAMTDTDALTSMNFTKYEDTATNKKYATHLVIDDKEYILGGVVDTEFNANSTNAIANGTVTNAFDTKVGDNNYAASPNYVTNNTSATKAIGDLDNALKNEADEREAADKDLQNQINNLGGNLASDVERLDSDVKSVGAMAAAMAGLHPRFTGDGKGEFAAAIGSYDGKKATAIGAFYAPDERFMFSLGGAFAAGGKKMANLGVNIALDPKPHVNKKAYEQEITELKAQVNMLMDRLAALEAKK